MSIERRYYQMRFTAPEEESRMVSGYGAVFNRESEPIYGLFTEIIEPGAFDEALQKSDVRALINHDSNLVLGRSSSGTLKLTVDNTGLRYDVDVPSTTFGNDFLVSLGRGDIKESSFGFTIKDSDFEEREGELPLHIIRKVDLLFDVSPVTFPAYPDTSVSKNEANYGYSKRSFEAWVKNKAPKIDYDLYHRDLRIKLLELACS